MRTHVITYGCQMNEYDTLTIQSELVAGGHDLVEAPQDAELILLNTCAVRGKPVEKVVSLLGDLRKARQAGRDLAIGLMGCLAQLEEGRDLAAKFGVDLLIGPGAITEVLPAIDDLERAREAGAARPRRSPRLRGRPGPPPDAAAARRHPHRVPHDHARLRPPLHVLHRPPDPRARGQPAAGRHRARGRGDARPGRRRGGAAGPERQQLRPRRPRPPLLRRAAARRGGDRLPARQVHHQPPDELHERRDRRDRLVARTSATTCTFRSSPAATGS